MDRDGLPPDRGGGRQREQRTFGEGEQAPVLFGDVVQQPQANGERVELTATTCGQIKARRSTGCAEANDRVPEDFS
ncbi:hypothetical protein [Mycolicibacterium sp. CBMA 226]|uniref:hypothetical protein n=1 Tax=Mycolicibacterium sp. CBMA 226 TaxID=2606611 RepID=UPI0012DE201D|nr:hypothetical protein [Mycolicibacterium sp. CBMA 226]MUL76076.1 hypothetical protein [Mycolicibacterium sp. CBMA 226]